MTEGQSESRRYLDIVCRALDLVVATALLLLLTAPMLLVAVAIRVESPGPALLRQRRVGQHGRRFVMYKFRSMRVDAGDMDADVRIRTEARRAWLAQALRGQRAPINGSYKINADPRITRLGALLRRASIDELPQLLNVLRGDMTLVGPRPCLDWEAEMFPAEFSSRFTVPQGITGLWQVSGRSTLSPLEMLRLDVRYVHTRSVRNNFRILALTIPALWRGDGAR